MSLKKRCSRELSLENIAAGVTHIRIMNTKTPQLLLKNKIETDTKDSVPKIHYVIL
jgi:hypothetical protein